MNYSRYGLRKRPMGPEQPVTILFTGKRAELLKVSLASLALAVVGAVWIFLYSCL